MKLKTFAKLAVSTVTEWSSDNAGILSAALSFYTFFSLAPLLLIAVGIAGFIFGEQAARSEVLLQVAGLVGPEGARAVRQLMNSMQEPASNMVALLVGGGTLLVGAAAVFQQLQNALNIIWKVPPQKQGTTVFGFIVRQVLSFGMVVSIGFLLLVSLIVSAGLAAFGRDLRELAPQLGFFWPAIDLAVSLGIVTLLFALIFKVLPAVDVGWKNILRGAFVTAVLFTIGKFLIGLYLGHSGISSTYGAAASLVVILLWIYYSSYILFFGAEFTKVYVKTFDPAGVSFKKYVQQHTGGHHA